MRNTSYTDAFSFVTCSALTFLQDDDWECRACAGRSVRRAEASAARSRALSRTSRQSEDNDAAHPTSVHAPFSLFGPCEAEAFLDFPIASPEAVSGRDRRFVARQRAIAASGDAAREEARRLVSLVFVSHSQRFIISGATKLPDTHTRRPPNERRCAPCASCAQTGKRCEPGS